MDKTRRMISLLVCSAAALLLSCDGGLVERPDTILVNGKIITVDPDDTIAEAIAIKGGKIIHIGSTESIDRLAGERTRRIDLNGLTATPGLIDSHCHFAWGGTDMVYTLDLSYPIVESIGDVVDEIDARIESLGSGEWLEARGWDEGKLAELRYIYASDLDPISTENPVWLMHTMGHYGTANSAALKLANITKGTPDPPGGTIDRLADGAPSGVLKESAMSLVTRLIPDITIEQSEKGIETLAREFNKEGMTAAKDPGIGEARWDAYQRAHDAGNLSVRIFVLWSVGDTIDDAERLIERVGPFTKPRESTGDDVLISGGIKMLADGSGGARTAWVYDEWNKNFKEIDKGNYGYPLVDPEIRRQQIKLFHDAGFHVSVHAIGDRAIDWIVDSYALALEENPIHGLRHGIIHSNVPTDHSLDVMAELQETYDAGYPEVSATFMWWIGDTYAGNWGPKRCLRLNPFKTYLDRGIQWGGASDFDVTPFPARYGLWASMARETRLGVYGENPYGMEEAVDIRAALRSYTIWNAHQLFLDDKIGSIEMGKYADIAVWDTDLYTAPMEDIREMECQLTLLGGEIVYQAPGAPITVSPAARLNH
jgi:predicted amidohydrolase YtcJ